MIKDFKNRIRLIHSILGLCILSALTGQMTTYSVAGSHTFLVPPGVGTITVEAIGAGGGGSKGFAAQKGTGGGGGGFAKGTISVTPGDIVNIAVGAGGIGGTLNGMFGMSGDSTIVTVHGDSLIATGGGGATATIDNPTVGFIDGDGGIGGIGINAGFSAFTSYCGGYGANLGGGNTPGYATPGGGGGGSADKTGNGRAAGQTTGFGSCAAGATANGGTALLSGGAGGNGGVTNSSGQNGTAPGGAGAGNAGAGVGGNGAEGKATLIYTTDCAARLASTCYTSFSTAYGVSAPGATIELLQDVALTSFTLDKNIVIIGGFDFNVSGIFTNNATLTIEELTIPLGGTYTGPGAIIGKLTNNGMVAPSSSVIPVAIQNSLQKIKK